MNTRGYWHCRRCNYQEPISKYKQGPRRFCPQCFSQNREQIPMVKKEIKPIIPNNNQKS